MEADVIEDPLDAVVLETLAGRFRRLRQVAVVGALVVATAVVGLWIDQESTLSSGGTTEEECEMGEWDDTADVAAVEAVERGDVATFLRLQSEAMTADIEALDAAGNCDPEPDP